MSDSPAPLEVREPEMTVAAVINEMDRLIDRMTSLKMTGDEKMTGDGRGESASPPPLEFREPEKTIDTLIDEPNNAPMAGKETSDFIQKSLLKIMRRCVETLIEIKGIRGADHVNMHNKANQLYDAIDQLIDENDESKMEAKQEAIMVAMTDFRAELRNL